MANAVGSLSNQWALITGATSGIGLACAHELARRGCNIVITGRRRERLEQVAVELKAQFSVAVETLNFDITSQTQTSLALNSANARLSEITILVNNAGLALGGDALQSGDPEDWEKMIQTNVSGLLRVTRACLPHMLKAKRGHIVNIGSVAGRYLYPGGAVYCATKFAVRAITEGLRMDVLGSGIRATNIEPGMVETEFSEVRYKGDKEKAKKVYDGLAALSAKDIAETVAWCVERPPHVNIQELVIYPTAQASVGPAYIHRT